MKLNQRIIERFPENLEREREARGWSRDELAREAGIHYDTLLRLERGSRKPNLQTVCDLADALGINVAVLLGGRRAAK